MIEITLTIVLAVFICLSAYFWSLTFEQKEKLEKLEKYREEFYSVLIKNEKLGEALRHCEAAHDDLLLQLLAAPTAREYDDRQAQLNSAREEIYHLKGKKSDVFKEVFNDLNNKA